MNVLTIALTILPPVMILIGIGVVLDRWWRMDLPTLSKITFALFVPALVFDKVVTSTLAWDQMGSIGLFAVLHVAVMGLCCLPLWWLRRWREEAPVISLGAMFFNAGNIGLPIAGLAFGETGLAVMAILLMVQNLTSFTAGVVLVNGAAAGLRTALMGLLRIPVVYAIVAALLLRWGGLSLPAGVMVPVGYLSDALIPVALVTLGIQFGRSSFWGQVSPVALTVGYRLLLSPVVAALLVMVLRVDAQTAAICICAAGMPVATNVFLIAHEFGNGAATASRVVFWSTLLSALSLPLLILWTQAS